MSVQQRGIGVSTSRQGGLPKERITRCETRRPAAGYPSDGSREDRWNYPHPAGTRPPAPSCGWWSGKPTPGVDGYKECKCGGARIAPVSLRPIRPHGWPGLYWPKATAIAVRHNGVRHGGDPTSEERETAGIVLLPDDCVGSDVCMAQQVRPALPDPVNRTDRQQVVKMWRRKS